MISPLLKHMNKQA